MSDYFEMLEQATPKEERQEQGEVLTDESIIADNTITTQQKEGENAINKPSRRSND